MAGSRKSKKDAEIARGVETLFKLESELGEIPIKLEGATRELIREREER